MKHQGGQGSGWVTCVNVGQIQIGEDIGIDGQEGVALESFSQLTQATASSQNLRFVTDLNMHSPRALVSQKMAYLISQVVSI